MHCNKENTRRVSLAGVVLCGRGLQSLAEANNDQTACKACAARSFRTSTNHLEADLVLLCLELLSKQRTQIKKTPAGFPLAGVVLCDRG